jgi:two-component system LytT family response regulator
MSPSRSTKAKGTAISAILVDDERLARKALRTALTEHPSIEIVGEADGVEAGFKLVEELHPDVIFLDVQMSPLDGFQLVNRLTGEGSPAKIVFVTAYDRYAIEAFETNALDYLTKPVLPERLAKTITRLEQSFTGAEKLRPNYERDHPTPPRLSPSPDKVFVLNDRGKRSLIRAREIHSIQSEGSYTHLQIQEGGVMMIRKSISEWEGELPADLFIRIGRSRLINRTAIKQLVQTLRNSAHLFLRDFKDPIELSRLEAQRLRKALPKE